MADETEVQATGDDWAGAKEELAAAITAGTPAEEQPAVETPQTTVETPAETTETPAAATEADKTDWKARFDEREKNILEESNKLAERAYNDLIRRAAAKSAAAYEALTGEKPPPDMFPQASKPADPNAKPEDSLKADLAELKAWRANQEQAAKQAKAEAEYRAQLNEKTEKLYEASQKHKDVYEHPHFGEIATAHLTNEFIKAAGDPKRIVDPQKLADDVAKRLRAGFEFVKQQYVGTKKQAAGAIPAGAGAAGGRQAGPVKSEEFDLSTRRGRDKAVNDLVAQLGQ